MRYHKNVTYEVEVKTVVRDEKGKIRRILRVWGSDPTLQRFTHFGEDPPREEFKKAARRRQPLSIDPFKNYTPAEVAGILNISYDSSLRQMEKMGAVDMGTNVWSIQLVQNTVSNEELSNGIFSAALFTSSI